MLEQEQAQKAQKAGVSITAVKHGGVVEKKFERLADQWRKDTAFMSSTTRQAQHPAYQQIIAMGTDAVPFILRRLEQTGEQWSAALQAITHSNPVQSEDLGNVKAMREAWLAWARENNYRW